MKIQIIFLIVCVVASFAQPEGNRSASSELNGQGEQQQQNENIIQGAATDDDELADSQEVNVNSSNETSVADGHRCNNWKWRRHNRRYWLRREKEMRRMNISDSDDSNDGERRQPVTSTCLETQTMPQNERTGNESSHHRHRPSHRHHHHHRNRTNTTTLPEVTNTTTSNEPLVEPFQEIQVPTTII